MNDNDERRPELLGPDLGIVVSEELGVAYDCVYSTPEAQAPEPYNSLRGLKTVFTVVSECIRDDEHPEGVGTYVVSCCANPENDSDNALPLNQYLPDPRNLEQAIKLADVVQELRGEWFDNHSILAGYTWSDEEIEQGRPQIARF